ncbi:MAG: glycosyltransferase [Sphingobacteriaceae bacterium]|jgi:glycosyltransferase involved in cell wall biosynthesis|nr:glycosyltransferase [Sphingobacteriaceae bacterium]
MRIGYDGKRIFRNFTGLGNYSRYILSLVNRKFPDQEFVIYTPSKPSETAAQNLLSFSANTIKSSTPFFKSFWRSFGIIKDLKKDKIDLYHGLSNELPFGISDSGIPSVVTIHDLIFRRYPGYYSKIDRAIYTFKSKYACRNATRIIAVSEQTKQDIVEQFQILPEKIDVVYQDCADGFKNLLSTGEKENIRRKYNLPDKFILNVGTIEPRKNLLLIVKALKLLDQEICLVAIGKEKPYADEVRKYVTENGLADRLIFLKDFAYGDLPGIYQQAEVFVYPSRYEGFGIPIVEALHSQVPVIAATGSCLEEAGGEDSLYTDPDDDEHLAALINTVLNNPEKRKQMIEAGNRHLQNFSDEAISTKLMNTYQKAIADAKR